MSDSSDEAASASIDSLLREAGRIDDIVVEPDRVGARIDRYRIDATLGRGGMGIVYEAEDLELGRRIALKVLPKKSVESEERRQRFLREARAAAAVSHPNLAALYDVGETSDGTVYIAMELVRGSTLRARLAAAKEGLVIDEALAIAKSIAHGLGKAHAANVVHRDLKPDNVMIREDGEVKIVDFGLAKIVEERKEADLSTEDGRILGTPHYMAPEQAKSTRVGPAADVFSFGVVLYEMLTGRRPFAGETIVDVLVAIARDEPAPPGKGRALDRVVMKCLAKDPSARFPNMIEVAAALEAVSASEPKRARWSAAATAAALAAVTVAVVVSQRDAPPKEDASPKPTAAVASSVTAAPLVPSATAEGATASAIAPAPPRASAPPIVRPTPRPSASAPASAAAPARSVDPLAHQK